MDDVLAPANLFRQMDTGIKSSHHIRGRVAHMRRISHRNASLVAAILFGQPGQSVNAAEADDACAFLTTAQVSTAVGTAVGDGTYVIPTFKKTCTWTPSDTAGEIRAITLNLQSPERFAGGKGGVNAVALTPASGIGDDAYYLGAGSTEGLFFKKGQHAFKIAVYTTQPLEKKRAMETALAKQVLAKL